MRQGKTFLNTFIDHRSVCYLFVKLPELRWHFIGPPIHNTMHYIKLKQDIFSIVLNCIKKPAFFLNYSLNLADFTLQEKLFACEQKGAFE